MLRAAIVLTVALTAGCEEKIHHPAPPPEDSGADRLSHAPAPPSTGRGYPDRLTADRAYAVRDEIEVRVTAAGVAGDQFMISITVTNRKPGAPLAFADWTRPGQVTLRDHENITYTLIPPSAQREKAIRDWEREHPELEYRAGAGPVTPDRARVTGLEFDPAAMATEYLDLDLDGGPVGWADPIRFRVPRRMMTVAGIR